ncbi:hypothetical protein ACQ5ES_08750 [Pseudidiomarina sp. E22-M8]|uniref:hypothetical protein n=1 Tax=Pseudidiomarina sp. E22-M8 TaxID=3424768 RepID=UPI00403CE1DC
MQKQRKHKQVASGLVIASVMLTAALLTSGGQSSVIASEAKCQKLFNNSEQPQVLQQCVEQASQNELSWGSWFSGRSRSTQFHFLDLFELLFDDSKDGQNEYGSNKKVSLG